MEILDDLNEQDLRRLERRIDELINTCNQLSQENEQLRAQLEHMQQDRSGLLERQQQVRSKVESMITRLKAMEQAA